MLIAVLDANVLYPMMLRDTLLRAAAGGCFRLHWSAEILDEVERNLVGDRRMKSADARQLRDAMEAAFPDALVEGYQALTAAMTNHPKDRHVAAVGAAAGAGVIVTSNVRDFRSLPEGLTAMPPDDFLQLLWVEDEGLVRGAIERQSEAFKKPKLSPDAIVDGLSLAAPGFVRLWRQRG